jgi:hypothetical protein
VRIGGWIWRVNLERGGVGECGLHVGVRDRRGNGDEDQMEMENMSHAPYSTGGERREEEAKREEKARTKHPAILFWSRLLRRTACD